jgi:hypothetical protein
VLPKRWYAQTNDLQAVVKVTSRDFSWTTTRFAICPHGEVLRAFSSGYWHRWGTFMKSVNSIAAVENVNLAADGDLTSAALLPSQYFGSIGARTFSSEQRLMLAVLVDAINQLGKRAVREPWPSTLPAVGEFTGLGIPYETMTLKIWSSDNGDPQLRDPALPPSS